MKSKRKSIRSIIRMVKDSRTRIILGLAAALLLPGVTRAELTLHFLDVGQGDAILVQCEGATLLVDAGPEEAGQTVNSYIKKQLGLVKLDAVIATHEHDDHLAGMRDALSGLSVDTIYSSPAVRMKYWMNTVFPRMNQEQGLTVNWIQEEESFSLGSAVVTVIRPLSEAENANDLSLVTRITYETQSVLLTADIENDAEWALLGSHHPICSNVLKIAHHGGNTSTCEPFLRAVNPQYAVISVGQGNSFGHPHKEVLNLLEKSGTEVYRTDLFGTIIMTTDGSTWTIQVMKAK